jgi:preprotein translocase subunit SecD
VDANELAGQIGGMGLLEFVDFGETPVTAGTVIRTDVENKYLQQGDGQVWHTVMTNDGVESAQATVGYQGNIYQVNFSMTEEGSQIFFEHTSEHINSYLGIVLDKVVISAPIIHSAISGGQGVISGDFTQEEAEELAVIFQTRPLPFPVRLAQADQ